MEYRTRPTLPENDTDPEIDHLAGHGKAAVDVTETHMKIDQTIIIMTGIATRTGIVSTGLRDDAQIFIFFLFN